MMFLGKITWDVFFPFEVSGLVKRETFIKGLEILLKSNEIHWLYNNKKRIFSI